MADTDKKGSSGKRISEDQRLHYIGFDVYPGKPKDLFKSKAEQEKFVEDVVARRQKGETLRETTTLMDRRISNGERILLTIASLAIFAALFLPWYSAYREVPIASPVPPAPAYDYQTLKVENNSALVATPERDSTALWAVAQKVQNDQQATDAVPVFTVKFLNRVPADTTPVDTVNVYATYTKEPTTGKETLALADTTAQWPAEAAVADTAGQQSERAGVQTLAGEGANEEILVGHVAARRYNKEYEHISGLGAFGALGSAGKFVFSSGFILIVSAIIMLINAILCVALPVVNLYGLYGIKGDPDEVALKLKRLLRLNWLPLILTFLVMVLSFIGASYGFDTKGMFASVGSSYGTGVLFNTLSWGIFVAIAASLVAAFKAIEI